MLLVDLCDKYNLLFIQEPPWNYIHATPSAHLVEGEAVVSAPMNPEWKCIIRAASADSLPPRGCLLRQRPRPIMPELLPRHYRSS